jgi:Na+/proline symporter
MSVYTIGVFASLILYIVVGNYAGRKVKHIDDYYVAGRNAPTVLILGTLIASYLSTTAFMGETGFMYSGYMATCLILICLSSAGYTLGALFFGRYLRRSESLTVPEFFGKRFNSRNVQVAAGVTAVVGMVAYLLAITQGGSLLMSELLGLNYKVCVFIVWITFTSFTFYAGSRGVVITDTIMFFIFTLGAILATPVIIKAAGGMSNVIPQLALFTQKPGIISWHGVVGPGAEWALPTDTLIWAIVFGFSWMGVVSVSPWQTSRYLMAKDEHTVIRSAILATTVMIVLYIFLGFASVSINLINPDIFPEKAFIWSAFNVLPAWLGVIVLAGIMAAALSSCSTFLSLTGFSLTRDVLGIKDEGKRTLTITRVVMIVASLVALILAYFRPPQIFWIGYFSGTLFFTSWALVAFLSIWNKKITAKGAFWGIIVGFVANIGWKLISVYASIEVPTYLDPVIVGIVLCGLTILIVSSFTEVTPEEDAYRRGLFVVPEIEKDAVKIKQTLAFPKILVVVGVCASVYLLFMYAMPYIKAIG